MPQSLLQFNEMNNSAYEIVAPAEGSALDNAGRRPDAVDSKTFAQHQRASTARPLQAIEQTHTKHPHEQIAAMRHRLAPCAPSFRQGQARRTALATYAAHCSQSDGLPARPSSRRYQPDAPSIRADTQKYSLCSPAKNIRTRCTQGEGQPKDAHDRPLIAARCSCEPCADRVEP